MDAWVVDEDWQAVRMTRLATDTAMTEATRTLFMVKTTIATAQIFGKWNLAGTIPEVLADLRAWNGRFRRLRESLFAGVSPNPTNWLPTRLR